MRTTAFLERLERLMGMTSSDWERHANPWSGWTRLSVLPLLALAVWSRVWIGGWWVAAALGVAAWTWINPRIFRAKAPSDGWMTRGVIGERIWLTVGHETSLRRHAAAVRNLTAVTGAGFLLLVAGMVLLNLALTACGLAIAMLGKLWLLDRMVWVYAETQPRSDV